ncbi:hypothetical protein MY11210_000130 [Beauveria gryllotalpidicola]
MLKGSLLSGFYLTNCIKVRAMCPKLLVDDPARLPVIAPHVETKRTPLANTRVV